MVGMPVSPERVRSSGLLERSLTEITQSLLPRLVQCKAQPIDGEVIRLVRLGVGHDGGVEEGRGQPDWKGGVGVLRMVKSV
jgi:hypothetical protein